MHVFLNEIFFISNVKLFFTYFFPNNKFLKIFFKNHNIYKTKQTKKSFKVFNKLTNKFVLLTLLGSFYNNHLLYIKKKKLKVGT